MVKNIVQDVLPRNQRSIRNIPLSGSELNKHENPSSRYQDNVDLPNDEHEKPVIHWNDPDHRKSSWFLWLVGVISVFVLIFTIGNLFFSAEISITSKTQNVKVDIDLVAKPVEGEGVLLYTPLALTNESEIMVSADSERLVENKASGKIIIYNNYSNIAQRLIKNTRFETSNNLIFRIKDSITIPGKNIVSGKELPGSIEVTVYADSPGTEYNTGLTDLTIPGFKSNPGRFKSIFARSKTVMSGGFVGKIKTASDEKILEAKARLEMNMKDSLVLEAREKVPKDYIFYDRAFKINFENLPRAPKFSDGDNIVIRERANFTAFLIQKDAIAKAIAVDSINKYDGTNVTLSDNSNLEFNFGDLYDYNFKVDSPIQFNLKGNAMIIWKFDSSKLISELSGKRGQEFSGLVSNYPAISKASFVIRPFWKNVFPLANSKIKILLNSPESN